MTLLEILTLIVMLVGLFGMVIPIFPGIGILWLAALTFGLIEGFNTLSVILFVGITLLGIAGTLVDNVLMAALSKKSGASWTSVFLAMLAGLVGTILLPPIGGLIAAPAVVLLLEYRRRRNWRESWEAVKGLMAGWGLSFLARFGIGLVMIILWLIWAWQG
jgi:uncharacterized protein YqgC (DUF456 family)